ncbi:DUF1178 family protein [Paremcibacter congregatus]|jgi:hypothetical protein|uniref:DUF1178 domain-containing protein n=1 Tax=Paremcibacter congregatus TaxID=2043170 RepID=A0A2G4YPQ9_9PROT|nr:DUF1178 family protein [Paremcibacter congregatus]PHZ84270.1 hypothetical protein CRD36_13875 [Paremcibacter congregatus]QDE28994.1 DUF1178 family protein [Paremcibacter congregatus]|tara:strand:- start:3023 stop:3523 length:501 start_codon:yes stop_codon:yes gene_type:complete
MIVFDLKCEENHVFEAWFRSSDAYQDQVSAEQIECPFCGSSRVSKSLMSPNISSKGDKPSSDELEIFAAEHMVAASANVPETIETSAEDVKRALQHMHETMKKYRNHVKQECEYVGENFAEEARAIHEGTAVKRGIYGEATLEDTEELLSEGVDILPVPGLGKLDS